MKNRHPILLIISIGYLLYSFYLLLFGEPGQWIASVMAAAIFYVLFALFKKKTKKSKKKSHSPTKTGAVSIVSAPATSYKKEKHNVTGTSHYTNAIVSLGTPNYCYVLPKTEFIKIASEDEREYEYIFNPKKVELIEEPTNPYDENAVKVVIDNMHVGYIKSGSCSHIKKLLHSDLIERIDAKIGGGRYKYFYSESDYTDSEEHYEIEEDSTFYFVDVILSIKENATSTSSAAKSSEALVWIDETASCYHLSNGCGMSDAYQVPLSKARALGKRACKRCFPK